MAASVTSTTRHYASCVECRWRSAEHYQPELVMKWAREHDEAHHDLTPRQETSDVQVTTEAPEGGTDG